MRVRSLVGFACLGLLVACSSASPGEDDSDQAIVGPRFTTEAEIANGKFEGEILSYWRAHATRGFLDGAPRPDGVRPKLAYDVVKPDGESQGALVIVHGMDENSVKYAELVYDLQRNGLPLTAYVINHRGQGFSDRLLDDRIKCHVDSFEHYVDDLDAFVNQVVAPTQPRNLFAFAHSMGGGIMTRYLERHPSTFHNVVMSSPMDGINTGWIPASLAHALVDTVGIVDKTDYFPKQAASVPYTTSPARAQISAKVVALYPEANLGGVTWGWLKQSLDMTRGPLLDDAKKIAADVKIFRAGKEDLVDFHAEQTVCDAINAGGAGKCDMVTFDDAKHEVWNERDEVRDVVLESALSFWQSRMR